MAIREIITGEDEMLRKKCRAVDKFDDRLSALLDDLGETLYKASGAGLAAIQVGILRRAVVIDVGEGLIELVNPEIIEQDGEQVDNEGCLSFPDMYGEVTRPQRVKVRAQNRSGEFFEVEGEGLLARALCHELDHLNGILFIDFVDELYEMD